MGVEPSPRPPAEGDLLLPRAKPQESVWLLCGWDRGFGVLGHCSAAGTFVAQAGLISVLAREHQGCAVLTSLATPALGSRDTGTFLLGIFQSSCSVCWPQTQC